MSSGAADLSTRVIDAVEANDMVGLKAMIDNDRKAVLNPVHIDSSDDFKNGGTILHWCVWFRKWPLYRMLRFLGAPEDTGGAGGGWMAGKSVSEYASLLDAKAKHPYYQHAKEQAAASADAKACNMSKVVKQGPLLARVGSNALTQADKYAVSKMVEDNALESLTASIRVRGGLVNSLVFSEGEERTFAATPAHWAVWYRHWDMLKLLLRSGADLDKKGSGVGWVNGRSVMEYAELLDAKGHRFYEHASNVRKCVQELEQERNRGSEGKIRAPSAADSSSQRCAVCLSEPASHIVAPCGHQCGCQQCLETLRRSTGRCPICRGQIDSVIRVFASGVGSGDA